MANEGGVDRWKDGRTEGQAFGNSSLCPTGPGNGNPSRARVTGWVGTVRKEVIQALWHERQRKNAKIDRCD